VLRGALQVSHEHAALGAQQSTPLDVTSDYTLAGADLLAELHHAITRLRMCHSSSRRVSVSQHLRTCVCLQGHATTSAQGARVLASRMPAALTAAQRGASKLDTIQQRQALRVLAPQALGALCMLAQQASGAVWHLLQQASGAAGIRRCVASSAAGIRRSVACWCSRHQALCGMMAQQASGAVWGLAQQASGAVWHAGAAGIRRCVGFGAAGIRRCVAYWQQPARQPQLLSCSMLSASWLFGRSLPVYLCGSGAFVE
jgi:hypothetical protein